jgi:hypothetical protein
MDRNKAINPYFFRMSFSVNTGFIRGDAEWKYLFSYGKKNQGFEVRAFAGAVGSNDLGSPTFGVYDYRLKMDGWNGTNDYLFSEDFLGRSQTTGLLFQQFIMQDGGFKTPAPFAESSTWLGAINLKTTLPGILPIRLFADIGFYDNKGLPTQYQSLPMFDYGVEIDVVRDILVIYLPIGWSSDIDYYYSQNQTTYSKYSSKIRFELNLSKINPANLLHRIEL